jgi:hypothetical protein
MEENKPNPAPLVDPAHPINVKGVGDCSRLGESEREPRGPLRKGRPANSRSKGKRKAAGY